MLKRRCSGSETNPQLRKNGLQIENGFRSLRNENARKECKKRIQKMRIQEMRMQEKNTKKIEVKNKKIKNEIKICHLNLHKNAFSTEVCSLLRLR